jgi:hypothetical protein
MLATIWLSSGYHRQQADSAAEGAQIWSLSARWHQQQQQQQLGFSNVLAAAARVQGQGAGWLVMAGCASVSEPFKCTSSLLCWLMQFRTQSVSVRV